MRSSIQPDPLQQNVHHPDPKQLRSPYRNHRSNPSSVSLNPSPPPPPLPFKSSSQSSKPQSIDFDEGVLRTLCGLECGLPLLIDRLKQAVGTSREVSFFLKKRAQLEEEYGLKLAKLVKERLDAYTHLGGEVKAGSFGRQYSNFLVTHERMGFARTEYGARLSAIADELVNLGKEVERVRKANKDIGWRLEKNLSESEGLTEKAKAKFDVTVEELERFLISKQADHHPNNPSSSGSGAPHPSAHHSNPSTSSNQPKSVAQAKALGKAISKLANKGSRSAGQLAKMEDEVRSRMSTVSDAYRAQVLATQQVRQEYFNLQLPRILRTLKEHSDETDLAIQYYLANYSTLSESLLVNEALSVSALPSEKRTGSVDESSSNLSVEIENLGGGGTGTGSSSSTAATLPPPSGLKDIVQSIDNRADFRDYMANYAAHFNQTHHAQLSSQQLNLPNSHPSASIATHSSNPSQTAVPSTSSIPSGGPASVNQPQRFSQQHQVMKNNIQPTGESPRTSIGSTTIPSTLENKKTFGVDLATQMMRDGIETVPKVVEKCVEAVEKAGGINMTGIYRLSGTTSKIARLKQRFDTDIDNVKLEVGDENQSEINDITGVMKLWFRELPEPLLTWSLYGSFIEAGRIENNRLRHIRLHERVNELPDPNYATLKYLMGHLDKIRRNEAINSMGVSNLAVIFGPTLLSSPPSNFYQHQPPAFHNTEGASSTSSQAPLSSNTLTVSGSSNSNGVTAGASSGLPPVNNALQDMSIQCKVVETILEHYREIFVDEGEEENEEEDMTSGTGGTSGADMTSSSVGVAPTTTAVGGGSTNYHNGHQPQVTSPETSSNHPSSRSAHELAPSTHPNQLTGLHHQKLESSDLHHVSISNK